MISAPECIDHEAYLHYDLERIADYQVNRIDDAALERCATAADLRTQQPDSLTVRLYSPTRFSSVLIVDPA